MPRKYDTGRKYNYQAVLDYIIAHKRANDGNSPGMRQIMNACGISSTFVVTYILDTLESEGKITRNGDAHHICVTGGQWSYQP